MKPLTHSQHCCPTADPTINDQTLCPIAEATKPFPNHCPIVETTGAPRAAEPLGTWHGSPAKPPVPPVWCVAARAARCLPHVTLPIACRNALHCELCLDVARRAPSCTAYCQGCADPRVACCVTPQRAARCCPPPRHEWHLTCRLVCLHGVECPRSSRALCSPALCLLYAMSCIAVCCAVSCTRPPLPPAAAPGSSCDPRGMCLGNYSPDRARGLGAELGEVQAEGGPRRQIPRTGQQGH